MYIHMYIHIFHFSQHWIQSSEPMGSRRGDAIDALAPHLPPMPALTLAAAHHARFTVVQSDAT